MPMPVEQVSCMLQIVRRGANEVRAHITIDVNAKHSIAVRLRLRESKSTIVQLHCNHLQSMKDKPSRKVLIIEQEYAISSGFLHFSRDTGR